MKDDDIFAAMTALHASNMRLKAERESVKHEISILKVKATYFNYLNGGKKFVCKGVNGTAIAEGKLMTFVDSSTKEITPCFYQSKDKAILAALKACT